MPKMLQFNEHALKSILRGVKTLSKAVTVTLGPKGRNVVIHQGMGAPLSTKDGVTVAKEIVLKDKFENIGVELVKEASSKTADIAGDGTTTAVVLAEAIFAEGVKNVISGSNPMSLKRGIEKAVQKMIEALSTLSTPISKPEEIKQIASIAANNDPESGKIIADAMDRVGKDGTITIAEANGIETELDVVEGMQFDKGYLSPYFVTNAEKMTTEFSNCNVFITDKKLTSAKEIVPFLEKVMEKEPKPLLIIAEDLDGEALATLVVNKLKAGMKLCAVKAPAFGDLRKAILEDIAILTGATVVSDDIGLDLEKVGPEILGSAKIIKVSKEDTTIIDGSGSQDKIKSRAAELRRAIADTTSDYDRGNLEERLAKIAGGVAVINVGAATEAEMKEKKARIDDALHATRAAVIDGIVPGGGVALIRAVKALDDMKLTDEEMVGLDIVRKAVYAPAIAIANNCGEQGNMIAEKIAEQKGAWGYNGLTGEFADLIEAGVIDPVLVTKSALKHASSIAGLLITVACMVTEKPQPKSDAPPMDGGMGGMPPGMGGMEMM